MVGEEIILDSGEFGVGAITGFLAGIVVLFLVVLFFVLIGIYIYTSLALRSIAKKSGYKHSWLAWIPLAREAMILQMGKISWGWIFLILIPVAGWIALLVLIIISFWRIFKKAGYAGALSLLMLVSLARLIVLGIVAWEKESYPIKKRR